MFAAMLLAGLVLSTADPPTSAAEKSRAGREDEKREDAAVRKAREAVSDAEQEVRQSQQALQRSPAAFREAEARRAKAGIELRKTVDRLERDHAESVSIAAARAALNTAPARFKEAALVRDNRDLFTARAMLARAQQSLVAKRLADLKDSNKPPKKDRDK